MRYDLGKHQCFLPCSLLCMCVCIREDLSKLSILTALHTIMAAQLTSYMSCVAGYTVQTGNENLSLVTEIAT